jgi:hypothetical protein
MSPVPGGADLERKNQYWIDLGASRERERIIKLLEDLVQEPSGVTLRGAISLIEEETNG